MTAHAVIFLLETRMRIGIDFGTTNSAVAYYDGRTLQPVELDPQNENPYVLPSLIWIDRRYQTRLGTAAAHEYLERETGRRIVWAKRDIGAIEIIVAGTGSSPIHYWHDVNIITDIAAKGRLLQSIKTVLRDPRYEGTTIFERYYPLDELIALILRTMREQASRQFDDPCTQVVLGRPVRFSKDPAVDERAEEILYRAARFAGFTDITFQLEPIAAAHLYHRNLPRREHVLVFDFGGGTLDLTIAEVGGNAPPQVLASRGVLLGGDDLDRRLMRSLLKYFGAGSLVDGEREFPPDYLDLLHTWQTMPDLSRPMPLERIRTFQKTSTHPAAMRALETLVTQNVGFQLFREIERAKKSLTDSLLARLDFEYQHIHIHERVLRRNFEQMIAPEVSMVAGEVRRVLDDAGMRPAHINSVLRTGGSSLVPAFVQQLEAIFGRDKIRQMDPLTSVVGGMAVVAQRDGGRRPAYASRYESPLAAVQAASGREYRPTILRSHRQAYTDRPYEIVALPLLLSGLHAIRPADLDYDSEAEALLRFTLNRPAEVYVIYQAQATSLPRWLRSFELLPETQVEIVSPGGRYPFLVYRRPFDAGAHTLGGAHARGYRGAVILNYLLAFKPLA